MANQTRQQFHPNIIDLEASGFGALSYPIEVGVVLGTGTTYCALVLPESDWTHWDQEAENMHQVSRELLQAAGQPAFRVAQHLNALLKNLTVYSDAWVVDKPWLTTLFGCSGLAMSFSVSPIEAILTEEQLGRWDAAKQLVIRDLGLAAHRARHDARVIQETYRRVAI